MTITRPTHSQVSELLKLVWLLSGSEPENKDKLADRDAKGISLEMQEASSYKEMIDSMKTREAAASAQLTLEDLRVKAIRDFMLDKVCKDWMRTLGRDMNGSPEDFEGFKGCVIQAFTEANEKALQRCRTCHKINQFNQAENDLLIKKCGACKKALYCSKTCQTMDWNTHQVVCRSSNSSS